jgi:PAS domain S-box-containing protein
LTIAALGWLVLGQINGWFIPVPSSATTGWSDFMVTLVILLMAVFSVDLLSGNLRNNLQRLQQEIINRNKTEEALRASEQRYRSLFENMSNGYAYCRMFYKDGHPDDFQYIAINKAFEKKTGLTDVAGKMVSEVIPGIRESSPELLKLYGRVALTGNNEYFQMFIKSLKMWFAVSVYSPQKEYFVAIFDVITERKQAEAAIRESEQRYKTLFESAAEGILIANIETDQQRFANPAICKMLGYNQEELQKMSIYDIHPKAALELVNAEFSAQARGEKITSLLPCLKKDGTIIYADINATKAVIDSRECNIGFFIEVTERVNAEKQIQAVMVENDALIKKLQDAAAKIDTLSGLIPMCACSKKICNDQGYWQGVEQYISEHSKADFTHSFCADGQKKYSPEIDFGNDK